MVQTRIKKDRIRAVFGILGDPSRFRMFELTAKKKSFCVSEVASTLKISVPAESQQFKILEMAGLVKRERRGQMICYKIKEKDPMVRAILKIIN